ncbi:MAG: glycoside hydrolase family 2 protein [Chloroflexi bacterium]|nr:glycoside hydrolase family 2 protein [Chloroflexota bacterium]
MQRSTLNGAWDLLKLGEEVIIPATVPGCVHTDLLAAGLIPDPYYRDNEHRLLWIGESDWLYRRTFSVSQALLDHERVLLRCHGLDTLATITLNGQEIGRTDNMFRTWEFDVKRLLRADENTIEVRLDSPMAYVRKRGAERNLPAWGVGQHKLDGGGWIRKEPCNFGWDWGPMLVTSGIWRDIELVAYNEARIADVSVAQEHSPEGPVTLRIALEAERIEEGQQHAQFTLWLGGNVVARDTAPVTDSSVNVQLRVEDPLLWWPHGMGEQPLYDLEIELTGAAGQRLDAVRKRLGLRTLRLIQEDDAWGRSFCFAANGVPFFAKGANWIPADTFAPRLTRDDYARLLQDAVAANMNMLRVWGGGFYEDDRFYDLCDELGICVWQDFIFSCATYPTFDAAFMANVEAEAKDNIRRLRHHASLALWCGNNELEQGLVGDEWTDRTMSWEDYSQLFDELLPRIVRALDPQRDYWPCSPHSPCGDRRDFNNPTCGDAHLWSVWHGRQPFEWYRTCTHRFNSEFGFQSFPEPRTTYTYTEPRDRNITSYVMEHHQRSGIGNTTIMTYMLDWFRLPTSFERTLWLSQILQGMAIKYACEHWRRGMPRGMSTLYWQINDCWPVASWSSIDSLGRWKALHYMAKAFYAPLLVSGLEDLSKGTVEIHVTSDQMSDCAGVVTWTLTNVQGAVLDSGAREVGIPARRNSLVETLDLQRYLASKGPRDLLLWLELSVAGEAVSTNLVLFARPKHLELAEPEITTEVQPLADGSYRVTLTAQRPALWAWLELGDIDARYSEQFFHLRPDRPREIVVRPSRSVAIQELREALVVQSLVDTYR